MAKPPWADPWGILLRAGRSAEEQYALIERASCLSAKGRADRTGVIALIERTSSEFQPWTPRPPDRDAPAEPMPLGWEPPSLTDALHVALYEAGYLDAAGSQTLRDRAEPESTHVNQIIAEVRAADVTCPRCRQPLPQAAAFCGYCGSRLAWPSLDRG